MAATYVIFAGLLAVALGEIAKFTPCTDEPRDKCTISQVRINPCDPTKDFCEFIKGTNVSMEFDFIPQFSTNNLKIGVSWHNLPFAGLTTDNACEFTTCPTTAAQQQTYTYQLSIGKKLPKGKFNAKWKVWNGDNNDEVCCFMANIKLTSKTNNK